MKLHTQNCTKIIFFSFSLTKSIGRLQYNAAFDYATRTTSSHHKVPLLHSTDKTVLSTVLHDLVHDDLLILQKQKVNLFFFFFF